MAEAALLIRPDREDAIIEQLKQIPGILEAWNLALRLSEFAARGMRVIDVEHYQRRLAACDTCRFRSRNQCLPCGHNLVARAADQACGCPLGQWNDPALRQESTDRWITEADLVADTHALAAVLPPDLTAVAGVARSGLLPATLLACRFHLPLYSATTDGLVAVGHGWRLGQGSRAGQTRTITGPALRKILLVEDTIFHGRTITSRAAAVHRQYPDAEILRAAIYVLPGAEQYADYIACSLPGPHYLEWNFFNSVMADQSAYDLDGIFCEDIPPGDDDDGPRYARAIRTARPRHYVRRVHIPLVATARLAKYRQPTLDWFERHGMRVDKLVMGPWANLAERNRPGEVARFKAAAYQASGLHLFVESCPQQAREIAELTGRRVLCPAAGRVISP